MNFICDIYNVYLLECKNTDVYLFDVGNTNQF